MSINEDQKERRVRSQIHTINTQQRCSRNLENLGIPRTLAHKESLLTRVRNDLKIYRRCLCVMRRFGSRLNTQSESATDADE